ncbi:MAG: LysR family transcriptional regulator [Verrucomicrobia bacterium]|nr:LysR family transcriptional regulator [Verrucomicrobiota bacterium]
MSHQKNFAMFNVHHLELFYYVARHGGISEAARRMPYGIQQPAISGQIIQLEEHLGVALFQRRPFALTEAGERLYAFAEPFFANLDAVELELQGGAVHQIRIGASSPVLRDHLPLLIRNVRKKFPKLRLTLREGYQPDIEDWLGKNDIDLAVTLLSGRPFTGVNAVSLLKLPLVLLVEKSSRIKSADNLWSRDKITEPLVALPASETICKNFQAELARRKIDWFTSVEVSSLELIETYVANGFGIGVSVLVPGQKLASGVRTLPLDGFAPVELGALWRGKLLPVYKEFLDELQRRAKEFAGGRQ